MKKITRHKIAFVISLLLIIVLLGSTGYLFYNLLLLTNVENTLRIISMTVISIIALILIILVIKFLKKYKKGKLIFILFLIIILSASELFVAYSIGKVYSTLDKVSSNTEYITYSSSIVTLADNSAGDIKDISSDETLGVLDDETSYEGSIIPNEAIEKNELTNETTEYSNYISMIDALVAGEINYIFLPTSYSTMFSSMEGYEDIADTTKIVYTQTKKVKKDSTSSTKSVDEPFTILLMGVDSEEEDLTDSAFNGDSLMVITFNPQTLTSTMLSIPRDSYVPIACFSNQRKNKITHAAWQGEECMQQTIENFLDIDIDYYVKINFKGVVKLVDTLGGVEVDVPYSLCEQNSDRQWGENTVYIEEGLQTLNGEQALAYARNRHPNPTYCSSEWTNYTSDDFIRGQHQQEIVEALLNKFQEVKSLDTVYDLLDTISSNMATNMSTEQILSLYNVLKDVAKKTSNGSDLTEALGIQKLYLSGEDATIYDYGGTNLSLYNYVLYDESVEAVSHAMKVNLGLEEETEIKEFSFNINDPYEEEIIGKMNSGTISLTLLPSFIGESLSYVNSFCAANGITVNVNGSGTGTVIAQSVSAGANVEDVSSITVTLSSSSSSSSSTDSSSSSDDSDTNTDNDVLGCTNSTATNFNPSATKDDGTCQYDAPVDEEETSD